MRANFAAGTLLLDAVLLLGLAARDAHADVRLPAVIGDHMVLQQETDVALWGWADAGESLTITPSWPQATAVTAKADANGRWQAKVRTPAAGGPWQLDIRGKNALKIDDVLIGEVWVCSGQSNMEWAFANGGVHNADQERAAANDPKVRLFDVPNVTVAEPAQDCKAAWVACRPDTVNSFSCVGWFFARELRKVLKVPVGLIGANWGGTVAEAWVSEEGLADFPEFKPQIDHLAAISGAGASVEEQRAAAFHRWWETLDAVDLGMHNGWTRTDFDDAGWETAPVPALWDGNLRDFDGSCWYRRRFELPAELAARDLVLELGAIDDMDQAWFDGERVGATEIHGSWNQPRRYVIPAAKVIAGPHVLVIRVVDTGGAGGFSGKPDEVRLVAADGKGAAVPLAAEWKRRVGVDAARFPPIPEVQPLHPNLPTVLFNGLVSPILPFGIRGALWYQGESNRGRALQYRELMPALIADWRDRFGRGDFPFLFVQIAPFEYDLSRQATAELRQAQTETLRVPNTGMVVTMDIGDPKDIHPGNKQEVGRRLALWALAQTYGKDVGAWSGPLFESMAVEPGRIRVRFTHTQGGLVARGGPLTDFELAGTDGLFLPASAAIDGDTVVVSSDKVKEPKEVRFGFADACSPNLFNGAGLPASPFCRITK